MHIYEFRDQRFHPIANPLTGLDFVSSPDGRPYPESWDWLNCMADYLGYSVNGGVKWSDAPNKSEGADLCMVLNASGWRNRTQSEIGKQLTAKYPYLVYITHVYPFNENDECLIGAATPADFFDLMARLKPTIDFYRKAN
jgi:hypothetical protein